MCEHSKMVFPENAKRNVSCFVGKRNLKKMFAFIKFSCFFFLFFSSTFLVFLFNKNYHWIDLLMNKKMSSTTKYFHLFYFIMKNTIFIAELFRISFVPFFYSTKAKKNNFKASMKRPIRCLISGAHLAERFLKWMKNSFRKLFHSRKKSDKRSGERT